MFKSAGLFDDPTDLEELALNDQDHLAEELNFELNF
jgi:hypothetical protein